MDKIRINITVDRDKLEKAKTKLGMFGGKLSTLFNAYLSDFIESMEKEPYAGKKETLIKLKDLDLRLRRLENARA